MRTLERRAGNPTRSRRRHTRFATRVSCIFALLSAAGMLTACAGDGSARTGKLELQEDGGFTITERARFGSGVRGDFGRALRLLEAEEHAEGVALLERVVEEAPHATSAHIDLGIAYRTMGELERAEASLLAALALNPRHPVAHNELGIVYRKLGRFDEARSSYESALSITAEFHFARRNLAILCDLYLREPRCALENYEIYAGLVPGDARVAIWIADLRKRVGN